VLTDWLTEDEAITVNEGLMTAIFVKRVLTNDFAPQLLPDSFGAN
jgi:hypothetical protein